VLLHGQGITEMPSENITNKEEVCKEQKYNPGNIKEAFKDFISQPIWPRPNIRVTSRHVDL
jgi:hypothetical protein